MTRSLINVSDGGKMRPFLGLENARILSRVKFNKQLVKIFSQLYSIAGLAAVMVLPPVTKLKVPKLEPILKS